MVNNTSVICHIPWDNLLIKGSEALWLTAMLSFFCLFVWYNIKLHYSEEHRLKNIDDVADYGPVYLLTTASRQTEYWQILAGGFLLTAEWTTDSTADIPHLNTTVLYGICHLKGSLLEFQWPLCQTCEAIKYNQHPAQNILGSKLLLLFGLFVRFFFLFYHNLISDFFFINKDSEDQLNWWSSFQWTDSRQNKQF